MNDLAKDLRRLGGLLLLEVEAPEAERRLQVLRIALVHGLERLEGGVQGGRVLARHLEIDQADAPQHVEIARRELARLADLVGRLAQEAGLSAGQARGLGQAGQQLGVLEMDVGGVGAGLLGFFEGRQGLGQHAVAGQQVRHQELEVASARRARCPRSAGRSRGARTARAARGGRTWRARCARGARAALNAMDAQRPGRQGRRGRGARRRDGTEGTEGAERGNRTDGTSRSRKLPHPATIAAARVALQGSRAASIIVAQQISGVPTSS